MNDVAIAPVKGNDCGNFFRYTSQDETISLLANAGLTEKSRTNTKIYYYI